MEILRLCSVEGCHGVMQVRGWCGKHYSRWKRNRRTDRRWDMTTADWIRVNIEVAESGCWLWTAATTEHGYGRFAGHTYAHDAAYECFVGPVPEGMEIDHVKDRGCISRRCVNPDHLEAVTHRENILRGESPAAKNARKAECVNGHPFTAENTYIRRDGGTRQCRECGRERLRRYRREGRLRK